MLSDRWTLLVYCAPDGTHAGSVGSARACREEPLRSRELDNKYAADVVRSAP